MIVAIKGILHSNTLTSAVVECGGIFYELSIPISTAEKLPKCGTELFLYTVAIYREDSQSLYGFDSIQQRDLFKILIEKVSGVGPKTALNMLSRMSVDMLSGAIASGDVTALSKCPGIGNKTAQRLIVELKDILFAGNLVPLKSDNFSVDSSDAVSALVSLGLKAQEANKAVQKALGALGANATTQELIKFVLSK